MTNLLIGISHNLFNQLKEVMSQLSDESYAESLPILSNNSIAKHIRHIIELYEEFVNGAATGIVSYDARKRNVLLEQDRMYALSYIDNLTAKLSAIHSDSGLKVIANFDQENVTLGTSVNRELAYNIEHAIHHMAILQIVLKHQFHHIELPTQFGIAYSTQAYLKTNVHA
jgi:uncharacterized damage-inducible protein DinB